MTATAYVTIPYHQRLLRWSCPVVLPL